MTARRELALERMFTSPVNLRALRVRLGAPVCAPVRSVRPRPTHWAL